MALITFEDLPSTSTPLNASNLNNNFNEIAKNNAMLYISNSGVKEYYKLCSFTLPTWRQAFVHFSISVTNYGGGFADCCLTIMNNASYGATGTKLWVNAFGLLVNKRVFAYYDNSTVSIYYKPTEDYEYISFNIIDYKNTNNTSYTLGSGEHTSLPLGTKVASRYKYNNDYYSTDETHCGTWIDGKPLYRKVIDIGTLPNNNVKYVSTGINYSNIDTYTKVVGCVSNNTNNNAIHLPHVDPGGNEYTIGIYTSGSNIAIRTGMDRTEFSGYAIIEYTKTTD